MSKTAYKYPESFGDCGEYLSEVDYDNMAEWPAMRDWFDEAVANDEYIGSYEEYIQAQQDRCTQVEDAWYCDECTKKLHNESVCLKECMVEVGGYKYDIDIIDGTHLKMKPADSDKWGIPMHFGQVPESVITQLRTQGKVKDNFFVAHQDRFNEPKVKNESAEPK